MVTKCWKSNSNLSIIGAFIYIWWRKMYFLIQPMKRINTYRNEGRILWRGRWPSLLKCFWQTSLFPPTPHVLLHNLPAVPSLSQPPPQRLTFYSQSIRAYLYWSMYTSLIFTIITFEIVIQPVFQKHFHNLVFFFDKLSALSVIIQESMTP